jgi:hypothetical protein
VATKKLKNHHFANSCNSHHHSQVINYNKLGPMLWFLEYFRRKILRKNWRFWPATKLNYTEKMIITLVFEKNANFFAENRRKSPKIAENCRKSQKIVENRRKLSKIVENCLKSQKIVIIISTAAPNTIFQKIS